MNDSDLDRTVATADPLDAWQAGFLAAGPGAMELREAILGETVRASSMDAGSDAVDGTGRVAVLAGAGSAERRADARSAERPTRVRRKLRLPLLAAAAVLAVLAASSVAFLRPGSPGGPGAAWAADVLAVANGAPRFLVTADGWSVTRADEFSAEDGEMTFGNGTRTLELNWRSGSFADWVADRAHSSGPPSAISIAGASATLFQYTGSTDFTALWQVGRNTMEMRGTFPTRADYLAVASTLRSVDVDTWLRAMPASVVRPDQRRSAVEGMLQGLPLPPGFDLDALIQRTTVSDRYQLGAAVSGAVACGWIESWVSATAHGDSAAAHLAAQAMAGSHDWAILNEMNPSGDYPEVLWEYADAMKGISDRDPNGLPMKVDVASSYQQALGCTD
jgi:hypothetical protein